MSGRADESRPDGYRRDPAGGARVRADIVDVYVIRLAPGGLELLLLERASDPLGGSWQPVMGHVETGETAVQTAVRELREEIGLDVRGGDVVGFWALEQVHPYYVAAIDAVVLSPRLVVQVDSSWSPSLNREHRDHRWVAIDPAHPAEGLRALMWPGQKRAVEEIIAEIANPDSLARDRLAIDIESID